MPNIVIIGGGVAGLSAAARLAPHAQVTLLEAEANLAYHASGRSASAFLENYGNDVVRVLNRASADYLHNAHGGVLQPRDMFLIGKPNQQAQFNEEAESFGLSHISLKDAFTRVPILNPETCGFVAERRIYDLDTDLFLQNFRRDALTHGAKLVTGAKVSALEHNAGHWHVTAGGQTHVADIVVNAAGAWADEVAKLAGIAPIGLRALRRSMARLPAPDCHDTRNWPFMDGVGDAWYAKPDAGELIVSPADEDPVAPQDAWADDMVLAEGLARYEEMVTTPVTRLIANWAGLRTFAPDRTLVIGHSTTENFFWLAGQGGYGFQTAAAASQLIADLILGQTPELPSEVVTALSPARFTDGG